MTSHKLFDIGREASGKYPTYYITGVANSLNSCYMVNSSKVRTLRKERLSSDALIHQKNSTVINMSQCGERRIIFSPFFIISDLVGENIIDRQACQQKLLLLNMNFLIDESFGMI